MLESITMNLDHLLTFLSLSLSLCLILFLCVSWSKSHVSLFCKDEILIYT